MKKILSLILCLMLSCSLVGCGDIPVAGDIRFRQLGNRMFMMIYEEDFRIYVDINEKTQYVYITDGTYLGGLELLVDSEGKPILYEGEIPYGTE